MDKVAIVILVIFNIPLFLMIASIMFGKGGVEESIKYFFTPDIISLFRGEYHKDNWAELKLIVFILLCVSAIWSEINFMEKHTPWLYKYFNDDIVYSVEID